MKTFAMTDIGKKRNINQDFVYTSEKPVGNLPNLFIVADGMGGHNAGDLASRLTVQTAVKIIEKCSENDPKKIMKEAVEKANEELLRKSGESEGLKGMGTTVVMSTVIDSRLYTGNVGDSRLYVIGREEMNQITKDHSLVEEMVRLGEIDPEDARKHPDKNIITRAIGASKSVEVDFFETGLEEGDVVLMCTDGLTNMVDDEEIRKIVLSGRDPVEKVETLINQGNNNGGKDNIGIIIVEPF